MKGKRMKVSEPVLSAENATPSFVNQFGYMAGRNRVKSESALSFSDESGHLANSSENEGSFSW